MKRNPRIAIFGKIALKFVVQLTAKQGKSLYKNEEEYLVFKALEKKCCAV